MALEGVLIVSKCLGANLMNARMHIDTGAGYKDTSGKIIFMDSSNVQLAFNEIADQITKIQYICSLASQNSDRKRSIAIDEWLTSTVKIRKLREKYFCDELFSDPAWDILLDLTIAKMNNRRISVSSLCIAASVPTTTALRKIKDMLADGLIFSEPDVADKRRTYINISDDAFFKMLAYTAESARLSSVELFNTGEISLE
jgi:hypothetical protein